MAMPQDSDWSWLRAAAEAPEMTIEAYDVELSPYSAHVGGDWLWVMHSEPASSGSP